MPEIQALLAVNENLTALGKSGVLGLLVPTQFGGACAGACGNVAGNRGTSAELRLDGHGDADALLRHAVIAAKASDALKQEVPPAIARGEHLSTLAFSEAGSGGHFYARRNNPLEAGAYQQPPL